MTDARFEQLVNLYLDKEISPEEFATLKAELSGSARRRRTFREYRSLRAAENQIICASYRPSPADDILPEPSAGQKLFAYCTQMGGMAAAVALAVSAFLYVTRGDSAQLGHSIASDLAQMGDKIDTQRITHYVEASPAAIRIVEQLMDLKHDSAVGASRVADQFRIWVVAPVSVDSSHGAQYAEAQPMTVEELAMRRHILEQIREMPGTSATVSFPGQQPFGYTVVAASDQY